MCANVSSSQARVMISPRTASGILRGCLGNLPVFRCRSGIGHDNWGLFRDL